jgi:hypothetical protein
MKKVAIKSFGNKENYAKLYSMLDPKRSISVYKNLHTGLWSLRQGGRVVCHSDYIVMSDVKFRVQPSGRAKVLREKKKNVHAFIVGHIVEKPWTIRSTEWFEVTYNPYKFSTFVDFCTRLPVYKSQYVDMATHPEVFVPVMATCD